LTLTPQNILAALQGNTPLSLVRIGDGEGIILNALTSYHALDLANTAVLNRQLGFSPSLDDIKQIRQNLITAYEGADIIGVPMHKQATSTHWTGVVDIMKSNCNITTDKFTSTDIGYDMLNAGLFDTLLQDRDQLAYISCRQLEERVAKKWNIARVSGYHISPEVKFTSGYKGEPHWPVQFNKAARWMDVVCRPGMLLLVGAGVVGKIYCQWWKERGGIAFDVGSVLDEWAGKVTRGPERGLDKEIADGKGYKI